MWREPFFEGHESVFETERVERAHQVLALAEDMHGHGPAVVVMGRELRRLMVAEDDDQRVLGNVVGEKSVQNVELVAYRRDIPGRELHQVPIRIVRHGLQAGVVRGAVIEPSSSPATYAGTG